MNMRAVITTSVACAVTSLLGLAALPAMSVAPGAEMWHGGLMLTVGLFFVGWLALALWARKRVRLARDAGLPRRLKTTVVAGGIVYVLLVLLCSVG